LRGWTLIRIFSEETFTVDFVFFHGLSLDSIPLRLIRFLLVQTSSKFVRAREEEGGEAVAEAAKEQKEVTSTS
jgi:hypothetical protein